ncbi:hypothetical protein GF323_01285 [Candidatus Woesearchaeota archaeon]|nr:hypothetical protein [Candidatus Woesearchaeota archaeon]
MIIVSLTIIMISNAYFNLKIDVFEQDTILFYNRLFFDRNLVKSDPISDRIYPGIFVLKKLSTEDFSNKLADTIYYGKDNEHLAAEINLVSKEKHVVSFFNPGEQKGFQEWILLAESWIPGPGGASLKRFIQPNILYIGENSRPKLGFLNTSIVMRND